MFRVIITTELKYRTYLPAIFRFHYVVVIRHNNGYDSILRLAETKNRSEAKVCSSISEVIVYDT